jgi:hypothetical protein
MADAASIELQAPSPVQTAITEAAQVSIDLLPATMAQAVITESTQTTGYEVGVAGPQGEPGPQGAVGARGSAAPKTVVIMLPYPGDNVTLFYAPAALTLTAVRGLVRGTNAAASFEVRYGPNRSAAGTVAASSGTITNQTTGTSVAVTNMPIPAGSYVWLVVISTGDGTTELSVALES